MLTRVFSVAATALILPVSGLLGVATAAELNTPTVQSARSTSVEYVCFVANVGRKDITVDIDLIDAGSTAIVVPLTVDIPAGHARGHAVSGDVTSAARCRRVVRESRPAADRDV